MILNGLPWKLTDIILLFLRLQVYYSKLWKILKEMGIPDHLTCLLRNLYAGQEATVRTRHGTTDWFQIGKRVHRAVYCHPAYLTYMQSHLLYCWKMVFAMTSVFS